MLVTPLHLAALQLDVASAAALLAAGAEPNAQARVWRCRDMAGGGRELGTPLHFAASAAPVECAGVAPGGKRGCGGRGAGQQPPPIVQWRTAAVVELLLEHGADLGARTSRGTPAVDVACGIAPALPWGKRRCPAAVHVLRVAASGGRDAVRTLRLRMARKVLAARQAEGGGGGAAATGQAPGGAAAAAAAAAQAKAAHASAAAARRDLLRALPREL